ncbi:MAG: hypothetical protein JO149_09485, partial [Gammaproteobacteria bacterium]|nr:hypothetical protein [Gammaproteobacteria bacterium]
ADQAKLKPITVKSLEKRGRQSTAIHFGVTKNVTVAKVIIESILSHQLFGHWPTQEINWEDARAVSDAFKQLLTTLEKFHA